MIVDIKQRPDENWVQLVQRATRKARDLAASCGVKGCEEKHLELKWQWAGHIARRSPSEWVWRVTFWRDSEWSVAVANCADLPLRRRAGRWSRWEDFVKKRANSVCVLLANLYKN